MAIKLSVGFSQKVGQPDYGSLGATCQVEFELAQSVLFDDLEEFQERVQNAYAACRQAVSSELQRKGDPGETSQPVGASVTRSNGQHLVGSANGHSSGHRASQKQLDYAAQLASHVEGLGVRGLGGLSAQLFGKPLAGLSTLDASGLIDTLKAIKAGKLSLSTALGEACS